MPEVADALGTPPVDPSPASTTSVGRGHGLQGGRDRLEHSQRRGEVFEDLASDDLGCRELVEVFQGIVAQPGDVEVDLVSGGELVVAERLETLGLYALNSVPDACNKPTPEPED